MTKDRAREILMIRKDADAASIKRQYHRLMMRFHPDAAASGEGDHRKAQEIIEAYRTVIGRDVDDDDPDGWWDVPVDTSAPYERTVYVRFRFFDHEDLPASEVARGKYIWDPEMEEFSLYCRSILELSRSLTAESGVDMIKDRFHQLMQAYIQPEYCISRLNAPRHEDGTGTTRYSFRGHVRLEPDEETLLPETGMVAVISCSGDRADVSVCLPSGETVWIGKLSFDEDCLYYVLLPMIRDDRERVTASIMDVKKPDKKRHRSGKCLVRLEAAAG